MNKSFIKKQILIIVLFIISTMFLFADESEYIVTSETTILGTGFYRVSSNVEIEDRISVTGDVTLFIDEDRTLTVNSGIYLPTGCTLIIDGQGKLKI